LGGRPVEIYGDDYPTPDGTCVRDYIHVSDLAEAHVRALDHLIRGGDSVALNLGTGQGHSVRHLIAVVEEVTGTKIEFRVTSRRDGDPAILVADPSRAARILGWQPQHSDLENIIRTAWNWHSRNSSAEWPIRSANKPES